MKIEVKNFTKILKRRRVLNVMNYEFNAGIIYGLHGRNGSGKTMLLRAICGLIFPTEGAVFFDGKELHKEIRLPKSMGVIIDKTELLPEYSAFTNLKILSKIKKVATDEDICRALEWVGLENTKKKVGAYSLGMKQKLSIAQALFEDPEILLLDEPTNALDEESVMRVRELLLAEKQKGKLIIIASHAKDDLNILADLVLDIDDGQIVRTWQPEKTSS